MTEHEVNIRCRGWLEKRGYKYKGILNKGLGQVPIPLPNESRSMLIDHQGLNHRTKDLIWIEAKGSGHNLSQLLEGFVRLCAAVYYGGGNGYLAIPHKEFDLLMKCEDFLKAVAHSANEKAVVGLLDIEKDKEVLF